MPYVIVFACLAVATPGKIAIWFARPVICALFITGANPLAFCFSLFGISGWAISHFGLLGFGLSRSIDTSDPVVEYF
jgi:hypothetical protein